MKNLRSGPIWYTKRDKKYRSNERSVTLGRNDKSLSNWFASSLSGIDNWHDETGKHSVAQNWLHQWHRLILQNPKCKNTQDHRHLWKKYIFTKLHTSSLQTSASISNRKIPNTHASYKVSKTKWISRRWSSKSTALIGKETGMNLGMMLHEQWITSTRNLAVHSPMQGWFNIAMQRRLPDERSVALRGYGRKFQPIQHPQKNLTISKSMHELPTQWCKTGNEMEYR